MHERKRAKVFLGILFCLCFLCLSAVGQQGPEQGGSEIQVWAGGGHSVSGGTANVSHFEGGLRYGWVLTGVHGPGFLRGNFEYVIDAIPVFLIFQRANTAYGLGLNPLGLKWNFVQRARLVPYFELGGGTLFTNHELPTGTSTVNFTPSAALGFHYVGGKLTWNLEARYLHISDAGLSGFNPGINSIQVRVGVGVFRHKH